MTNAQREEAATLLHKVASVVRKVAEAKKKLQKTASATKHKSKFTVDMAKLEEAFQCR